MQSKDLNLHSLKAISPIDGRHRIMTEPLSEWFSEFALFKYRLQMQIEYAIALSELSNFEAMRTFTEEEKRFLRRLVDDFSLEDAQMIQDLDRFGYNGIGPTNHDFKAVEYFLKMKMKENSLSDVLEMVHFGLTTEDCNNLAHNYMIKGGLKTCYLPALVELLDKLCVHAENEKSTVMLSRTHGQPATPTTFGKEMANFLERLRKELVGLESLELPAKINGVVGNHAAQQFAAPEIDWIKFAEDFIIKLGFEPNLHTTQIEPHDGLTELFSRLISINNILRDLAVDLWMYISSGYLVQKNIVHEVGSSTMPHKINPWRVEVAEGSTVEANAKLVGFINKLQASRLQRDCSDHEAQRAIGVGVAHSYLAVLHVVEELDRLTVDRGKMLFGVEDYGSILTEAVQTLLRKEGYSQPYELLKDFSRGKHCTVEELHWFVNGLEIREEVKQKLKSLRPENYIGLSTRLVDLAVDNWKRFKEKDVKGEKEEEQKVSKEGNGEKNQIVAILGGQWGDEGKGKIVDWAAKYFDVSARGTGGNNAGHTVKVGEEEHIFHLIPSAITWKNVDCLLGNGMVIDPMMLLKEIHTLEQRGHTVDNLYISGRAHVILLYNKILDNYKEKSKGEKNIGTTGRGIGPTYADKAYYTGVRTNDLLDKEILQRKIGLHVWEKFGSFKKLHGNEDRVIMESLRTSLPEDSFFDKWRAKLHGLGHEVDLDKLTEFFVDVYYDLGMELKKHFVDTRLMLERKIQDGKSILLEGAQGLLLDVDHGTYPFVTSSNASIGGLKTGLGLPQLDLTYSIIKAYTTRVGTGPFPTELFGEVGDYLREKGHEFGSTTSRPRRCGWPDAVLTRHTALINGPKIVISKLDVLTGLEKIKICNSYKYLGPQKTFNGEIYFTGKIIKDFPADGFLLERCVPHEFIEMPGWTEDITSVKEYNQLPVNVRNYLGKIEELGNVEISVISVGPEREQTIVIPGRWKLEENKSVDSGENFGDEKVKAVIYDLDNTLIATNNFVLDLIRKTALEVGQDIPFVIPTVDEVAKIQKLNLPFEEIFANLFQNPIGYVREEPLWSLILKRYRERAKSMHYLGVDKGVEVVKALKENGLLQGIVTNRIRMASERLEQAGYPEFSFLFSPESKEDRKPSAKAFNLALKTLSEKGIDKSWVLSVGDHPDDYVASKAAGLKFIGVVSGNTSREEFLSVGLGDERIIDNLGELKDKININLECHENGN
ncbi:adenylosuccinate lyase [Candidatus Woesearchaeota archaeon]|jgi:adenylosuccinate synthase/adenylosuccinate lyase/phosphoglycolate phosphatase-like HAD superfamily hydrolase|nr:adenylosuccinate lyase [Candidatus Woesearchaeota archaeon]